MVKALSGAFSCINNYAVVLEQDEKSTKILYLRIFAFRWNPYYIGKGQRDRVYQSNGKPCAVPKNKKQIIFLKTLLLEEDAYRHEKYMIAVFGRKNNKTGILQNRTDGGEGGRGVIWTTEMKENKSIDYKNKNIKPPIQKGKKVGLME